MLAASASGATSVNIPRLTEHLKGAQSTDLDEAEQARTILDRDASEVAVGHAHHPPRAPGGGRCL